MSHNKLTIAFTWWGSGGHILPLVSLLQTLDEESQYSTAVNSVYRFGEKKGMEYDFYNQYSDTFEHIKPQFIAIIAGKYRRETLWISRWRNIRDIFFRFPRGIIQSLRHLATKRINVVIAKWWYVSLPVVIAAWILRRRVYVHESDTSAGLTTKVAARFARQSFTWFPDTLPCSKTIGQLLSSKLLEEPLKTPLQLDEEKIIILVSGWSLGSQKLYQALLNATASDPRFASHTQIVIINGKHLIDPSDIPQESKHIIVTGLIKDQSAMGWLYRHADIALVRAGTTTLAEAKMFDLPLIMVPLPITHDQQSNAMRYVDNYWDISLDQDDIDFVQNLYKSLARSKKRPIVVVDNKTKKKIAQAKKAMLDAVFEI